MWQFLLIIIFYGSTAYAGMNFTNLDFDKAMVTIPMYQDEKDKGLSHGGNVIRSTEDALLYGEIHKSDIEAAMALKHLSQQYDREIEQIYKDAAPFKGRVGYMDRINVVMVLAFKGQLCREALSVMDVDVGAVVYSSSEPWREKQ